jgi:ketopantoate reductase
MLTAIAPKAGKAIQQAATDITAGLQKGLSFSTIQENSKALADIMKEQITETEALNQAVEKVADNAGLAAENLKDLVGEKTLVIDSF